MNNLKRDLNKHNSKVLRKNEEQNQPERKKCNCQKENKKNCPLKGNCVHKSVVYQADIKCKDENGKDMPMMTYIGSTERFFKLRWYEHNTSFNNDKSKKKTKNNSTTISTYIWKLKHRGLKPQIEWSIKAKAHAYEAGSTQCDLCLTEKMHIMFADSEAALNSRNELLYKCRHMKKFLLSECP